MIDQAGWDRTDTLPLGGPVNVQVWQQFANSSFTTGFYIYFKEEADQFWTWPQPAPVGKLISYKYQSRNFVKTAGGVDQDYCSVSDDVPQFDPTLLTKFVVLRFKEARGYDTTAAAAQFNAIYKRRVGTAAAAPVLSISARRGLPLISTRNIPESNFG
jgi:hypothetical protein